MKWLIIKISMILFTLPLKISIILSTDVTSITGELFSLNCVVCLYVQYNVTQSVCIQLLCTQWSQFLINIYIFQSLRRKYDFKKFQDGSSQISIRIHPTFWHVNKPSTKSTQFAADYYKIWLDFRFTTFAFSSSSYSYSMVLINYVWESLVYLWRISHPTILK